MTRTVVVTALAVLAMFAFTAVGWGGPPTGGIIATCAIGGESVVSGFKGNPDRVDFFWTSADGFRSSFGDSAVGGKFGSVATQPTPTRGSDLTGAVKEPWSPDTLTFSVIVKGLVAFTDDVPCRLTGP